MRKLSSFLLLSFLATFSTALSLELGAYFFLRHERNRLELFFEAPIEKIVQALEKSQLEDFLRCRMFICFHPELGWWALPGGSGDRHFGRFSFDAEGARNIPGAKGPIVLAAYGDSFTEGTEVGDEGTWQAALAAKTGLRAQNFGVMGYGPDQALLYFQMRLAKGKHPPLAVLSLISESSNRLMNSFHPFYSYPHLSPEILFKPFLVPEGNSYRFTKLIPANPEDHGEFIKAIYASAPYDAFFQNRDSRFGFPFALSAIQFLRAHGLRAEYPWPGQSREGRRRLGWVLDQFHKSARSRGVLPVLMLMPQEKRELQQTKTPTFEDLFGIVEPETRQGLLVIDVLEEWQIWGRNHPGAGGRLPDSYFELQHPSRQGNAVIADMLLQGLCRAERIRASRDLGRQLCGRVN